MNTRTSSPRDLAEDARRLTASRARRAERNNDPGHAPARGAHTLRLVTIAAVVSVVSLVVVTTWHDGAARGTMAIAAAPHVDTTTPQADKTAGRRPAIDHGAIAPDAPSAGDAETVEASVAAYER